MCFRYAGPAGDGNELNRKILDRVIRRGRVSFSNALLNGNFALRACIVNHRSTEEDVRLIVTEVLAVAEDILGTSSRLADNSS